MTIVALGAVYYPDPTVSRAIFNGDIYVGVPDTDPEIESNRKQVTLRMEDGSEIPVSQPIDLGTGGVPVYNGSPVMRILVDGNYSLKVLDSNGAQKYYIEDSGNEETGGGSGALVQRIEVLAAAQVLVSFAIDLTYASFYINGSGVDIGRLTETDDYTVNYSTSEVTLTRSYPAGTKLTAAYNETGIFSDLLSSNNIWTGTNTYSDTATYTEIRGPEVSRCSGQWLSLAETIASRCTITNPDPGRYLITFDVEQADFNYVVTATIIHTEATQSREIRVQPLTLATTGFEFAITNGTTLSNADGFNFTLLKSDWNY